jgi:hypothetical protein
MTTDLRAIEVRVNDYGQGPGATKEEDDGHVEIVLEPPACWEDLEGISDRDWHLAAVEVAGVLGRVAAHLSEHLALSAFEHRCLDAPRQPILGVFDSTWLSGCHLGVDGLARTSRDMSLSVIVPRADVPLWLDRIRELLEAIADDANQLDAVNLGASS